jgi:tetratricopeptide (TPR) repeat protein
MNVRSGWGICLLGLVLAGCSGEDTDPSRAGGLEYAPAQTDSAAAAQSFDTLFAIADDVYFAGEYDSAVVLLQAIQRQADSEGDLSAQAKALTGIGWAYYRLADHSQARQSGEMALAFKQRHGLVDQYFESYNALGTLAWMENRLFDAERLLQQAIASARARNDRRA